MVCQLLGVSTAWCVNCVVCPLLGVSIAWCVNCLVCQLCSVETVLCVSCVVCRLRCVSTALCVSCVVWHSVETAWCGNCMVCHLRSMETAWCVNCLLWNTGFLVIFPSFFQHCGFDVTLGWSKQGVFAGCHTFSSAPLHNMFTSDWTTLAPLYHKLANFVISETDLQVSFNFSLKSTKRQIIFKRLLSGQ